MAARAEIMAAREPLASAEPRAVYFSVAYLCAKRRMGPLVRFTWRDGIHVAVENQGSVPHSPGCNDILPAVFVDFSCSVWNSQALEPLCQKQNDIGFPFMAGYPYQVLE